MISENERRGAVSGLRFRLVVFCLVIAVISIGTTAWIAVSSTSSSLNQQYSQNLSNTTAVYSALSEYAATQSSWDGVTPLVEDLEQRYRTRITLTHEGGTVIVDSHGTRPLLIGTRPTAVINPLQPDVSIGDVAVVGGVDARALGPYRLTPAQQAATRRSTAATQACIRDHDGLTVPVETLPNGRVFLTDNIDPLFCPLDDAGGLATVPERQAGQQLLPALARCFPSAHVTGRQQMTVTLATRKVTVEPASAGFLDAVGRLLSQTSGSTRECVIAARRAQLAPFVAPPAQLFLSTSVTSTLPGLTGVGLRRVVLAGTVILLATLTICFVAASRVRRPLAELTDAVTRIAAGARTGALSLHGTSEMRQLAVAVNDLTVQLDTAEQRRQDMVSDIAHELRTPLGNVRGWVEAMQDGVVDPDAATLGRVHGEALVLQRLIDDLQDLALADAGQLALHPERIDLAVLAEQVVTTARVGAPGAVAMSLDARGDAVVQADPVRFRQIVGNLVSNAQRATATGSIRVTVTGRRDEVTVAVTDTGRGIGEDDLPHLFDRFWRADKSRSRARGGSGLGLAITHALVTAHGGHITVTSEVMHGTTVTVHLPRRLTPG
ncbi:HAMP domain-containing histidine kinase [Kineosporia sp. J2-2]|uniref:histidine kinase n=1 Tax=Kineosporia corallincola TaxID=2835133 RepID=A0ABS5TBG8_9ACTN|nr:HAMP domain-containing sensor histidine kinase [Kineosporia corallincola]MBT0768427.1 HAMP domain-containing histidine kinase [Kineosporia corallincola]